MPYAHIIYIRLAKRILNDPRWFTMSEKAQLVYVKFLLLLAHFDNRVTKDEVVLIQLMRTDLTLGELRGCIQEIRKNFPKFKSNKYFYYMDGFEDHTNYIPKKETRRKSRGNPGDALYKSNSIIYNSISIPPQINDIIKYCKERKNNVDPNKFFNHYEAKGWMIGKNKMKDWKAAVRTWEHTETASPQFKPGGKTPARIRVMTLRTAKIPDSDIKQQLVGEGYKESEIDEVLGKEY